MSHTVRWHMPSPLWSTRLQNGARRRFSEPTLLRFASDDFMEVFRTGLDRGPEGVTDLLVEREGFTPRTPTNVTTLFQPVHQRYYLVSASLVCRERGLPDRAVDVAAEERASFVLRRLVATDPDGDVDPSDATTFVEYGWFEDTWKPVTGTRTNGPRLDRDDAREERLPMFAQPYDPQAQLAGLKRTRRVWAGFVPVARREQYEAAPIADVPTDAPSGSDPLSDPRKVRFDTLVVQAFERLRASNFAQMTSGGGLVDGVHDAFVFGLLDLHDFLDAQLPVVHRNLGDPDWTGGSGPTQNVHDALTATDAFELGLTASDGSAVSTWAEALLAVNDQREAIESGSTTLLGLGPAENSEQAFHDTLDALFGALDDDTGYQQNAFATNVRGALPGRQTATTLPDGGPLPVAQTGPVYYQVRCVYERPNCEPYRRPVVSAATRPFRFASFFESDAPVRPIRISLPAATSVSDFRNGKKGVAMIFSDELRNQVQRVQDITFGDLDEGDVGGKGGFDIGMICSLSIPIITICALILLLVIVFLLNIVFWWLPFFKICFPIPKPSSS